MISSFIKSIQDFLDFKCFANPQFSSPGGLGRVGILGTALGISLGFHLFFVLLLLLQLFEASVQVILLQWSLYIIFLSMFHLSEFFVTAIYNPKSLTADSFIVNHSEKYTIAVFVSYFFCSYFISYYRILYIVSFGLFCANFFTPFFPVI